MLDIAGGNASKIPLTRRAAVEKQLFGAQGFGGFALLSDPAVKEQVAALMKEMNGAEFENRYGSFMQDYSSGSPVQKGRQSWADLQGVLMDIGTIVLPPVVAGLKDVDEVLNGIRATFGSAGAFERLNADQKVALKGITDGLDNFVARLRGIAGFVSGLFGKDAPGIGGAGGGGMPRHPSGLSPSSPLYDHRQSSNATPIHNRVVVMLDGRILGEAMSSQMAQLSTFPRQASYADPYASWAAPDYNFQTG